MAESMSLVERWIVEWQRELLRRARTGITSPALERRSGVRNEAAVFEKIGASTSIHDGLDGEQEFA